jgi:hypothetical protein
VPCPPRGARPEHSASAYWRGSKLAKEATYNGSLDSVAAQGIGDIVGAKMQGTRTGNCLTKAQAEKLINYPDTTTLKGRRDRASSSGRGGCASLTSAASTGVSGAFRCPPGRKLRSMRERPRRRSPRGPYSGASTRATGSPATPSPRRASGGAWRSIPTLRHMIYAAMPNPGLCRIDG